MIDFSLRGKVDRFSVLFYLITKTGPVYIIITIKIKHVTP